MTSSSSRPNDFAQAYLSAHAEAGMDRILLSPVLHRIAENPGYIFDEELKKLAGHCPAHADTRQTDYDKIAINTLLATLYDSLLRHIINGLPVTAEGHIVLLRAPDPLFGLDPADREGLARLSPEDYCAYLRDTACHLLDALVKKWAIELMAEEEHYRTLGTGEISARAAANFVLAQLLDDSPAYNVNGYDVLSITKTGSHTALHVCWSLVEAAPMLAPGRDAAFYDALVRRSLKQILPLAMGSLGMLSYYIEASHMEADHHQATHVLPPHQTAFLLGEQDGEPVIRLNTDVIKPIAQEGERHFTGCPAFYVVGMINAYMEIVLGIAAEYGVFDRLQERNPA
ncbi:MAG TPA: hypothetical protein VD995_21075 [Azospirillum sp.]|nr:hypothetical protein [Azospirillum sp.]